MSVVLGQAAEICMSISTTANQPFVIGCNWDIAVILNIPIARH